ncbi:MAG: hypothetical protein JW787_14530 [Sedimentisphaerales bacterium]|nr:hypothetical protein [Sedimentisphaerales bacterium]
MDTNKKDELNDILKEAHEKIQPRDSWQALRNRIDERINNKNTSSGLITKLNGNISFWRRAALAAAACLVITSALLICVIFDNKHQSNFPYKDNLLAQNQLENLSEAFSHVQDLFEQNCPWMIISAAGKGELGDENQKIIAADNKKLIVLRLAVNIPNENNAPQYFDVVTFENQLVTFDMPVTGDTNMNLTLKSAIVKNNMIEVEIYTQLNSGVPTNNIVTIANDSFKTLARVKANGSWININATGQSLSNI